MANGLAGSLHQATTIAIPPGIAARTTTPPRPSPIPSRLVGSRPSRSSSKRRMGRTTDRMRRYTVRSTPQMTQRSSTDSIRLFSELQRKTWKSAVYDHYVLPPDILVDPHDHSIVRYRFYCKKGYVFSHGSSSILTMFIYLATMRRRSYGCAGTTRPAT